jgi:hypothetical protein
MKNVGSFILTRCVDANWNPPASSAGQALPEHAFGKRKRWRDHSERLTASGVM